ncbi:MAG TPA: flavodoxin domain-containing protein [Actinomycetes bacterium]|nr:flavodoxin domain-containing protein [Actinomycetes bacterium]
MAQVLVAYATKNGSTEQVARVVAGVMGEAGARVDVRPAGAVKETLERYSLVVLGGALYRGRWHRDARRFLRRHRGDLVHRRVAVFGMGPREDDGAAWQRSRTQLDNALARYPTLTPTSVAVFGGVDPKGRKGARRDLRDWDAIRAWAYALLATKPTDQGLLP